MVSNANTKEYSFAYAEVPEEIKQHSFTILDTSEVNKKTSNWV